MMNCWHSPINRALPNDPQVGGYIVPAFVGPAGLRQVGCS